MSERTMWTILIIATAFALIGPELAMVIRKLFFN